MWKKYLFMFWIICAVCMLLLAAYGTLTIVFFRPELIRIEAELTKSNTENLEFIRQSAVLRREIRELKLQVLDEREKCPDIELQRRTKEIEPN